METVNAAQPVDWLAVGPPLVVVTAAIVALFLPPRARLPLAIGGLLVALAVLAALAGDAGAVDGFDTFRREAFCTPGGCSYQVNGLTLVVQLVVLLGTLLVLLLSGRRENEYHFLLLASAAGAVSIAAARDLITIAVSLELVTLPAIAVIGLRADRRSAESTVKFFLFSVVSSAVMLFGIGLVYGATGNLQLDAIGQRLGEAHPGLAMVASTLTLVGFAFKLGAVPFHFWVPDTYVGAPVPVAAYLSVVSKTAGLVALISVVGLGFGGDVRGASTVLAAIAGLTMTVGNLVALRQSEAVRLLAWSSVAQVGFVLLPLGAMATGPDDVPGAAVAYLAIYAVFNLGAFAVVAVAGPTGGELSSFRGLFHRQRWLALAMAFFLLGLAGLPPGLAGLFGKVVVIQAAVAGGATWLAVLAAINVAIGLAYYLRWVALLFARSEEETAAAAGSELASAPAESGQEAGVRTIWANRAGAIAVGLLVAAGVALSVVPDLALGLVSLGP